MLITISYARKRSKLKVFELAKKLNRTSKEILSAAYYFQINVDSHLSNLTEQEVDKIIKYFKKKEYSSSLKNISLYL
jgi:hypothetical protein